MGGRASWKEELLTNAPDIPWVRTVPFKEFRDLKNKKYPKVSNHCLHSLLSSSEKKQRQRPVGSRPLSDEHFQKESVTGTPKAARQWCEVASWPGPTSEAQTVLAEGHTVRAQEQSLGMPTAICLQC